MKKILEVYSLGKTNQARYLNHPSKAQEVTWKE